MDIIIPETQLFMPTWAVWLAGVILYFLIGLVACYCLYRKADLSTPEFDRNLFIGLTFLFWPFVWLPIIVLSLIGRVIFYLFIKR